MFQIHERQNLLHTQSLCITYHFRGAAVLLLGLANLTLQNLTVERTIFFVYVNISEVQCMPNFHEYRAQIFITSSTWYDEDKLLLQSKLPQYQRILTLLGMEQISVQSKCLSVHSSTLFACHMLDCLISYLFFFFGGQKSSGNFDSNAKYTYLLLSNYNSLSRCRGPTLLPTIKGL